MDAPKKRFRETRSDLASRGFRPSSARGQNFLLDTNLLDAIVRDAALDPTDTVVEVGSGPGGLTERLSRAAAKVIAFELDTRLAEFAAAEHAGLTNVRWIVGDVLGGESKHGLHPELRACLTAKSCVLVANLPYNIAAPFLANVMAHSSPPRRAIVMVQREVALRLLAAEGTKNYGPLTVSVRSNAVVERVRNVPRDVFRPRPNVESMVIRLVPRPDRLEPADAARLKELIALAFRARRKKLAPQLESWFGGAEAAKAKITELGYSPLARGEELSVEAFRTLARAKRP